MDCESGSRLKAYYASASDAGTAPRMEKPNHQSTRLGKHRSSYACDLGDWLEERITLQREREPTHGVEPSDNEPHYHSTTDNGTAILDVHLSADE